MLGTLLALLIGSLVALVFAGVLFAVVGALLGLVIGGAAFVLFKVVPILLIGWVVLKLIGRSRGRGHLAAADERWLDN